MEFLAEYGLFLLKAVTIVAAIVIVIAASRGDKGESDAGSVSFTQLNERYDEQTKALQEELDVDDKKLSRKEKKQKKKQEKEHQKTLAEQTRMFVIDFDGDIEASQVEALREQITAIISVAKKGDSVLLNLESPGGAVTGYGLAASQLQRLSAAGIELTAVVDRVAASGGYLMAVNAQTIVAAPFAVVGSIGVVAQLPNIHRLLKDNKIDIELHTAGEHKRTLTMLGENTDEGREKFKQDLEVVHRLFKQEVAKGRPQVDLEVVSTGEYWYGEEAMALGLIDKLQTSDDLLIEAYKEHAVYSVDFEVKRSLSERLSDMFAMTLTGLARKGYSWAVAKRHGI